MSTIIRKAVPADAAALLRIKNQLPMQMADGSTTTGGFLLGTDEQTYKEYIAKAYCLVAEDRGMVVGFGIIFPDSTLRQSDIWLRRNDAVWYVGLSDYEDKQLCYFEQFAFAPGYRKYAVILAYNIIRYVFYKGAEALFTTTVHKPVLNLAPLPFIHAAKGIKAGNINEVYPIVGAINSDIYLIESQSFYESVQAHTLFPFFEANTMSIP